MTGEKPVFHGGDLSWADERFGIPAPGWIDLSTGINPFPYPVGAIPPTAWTRLPDARALGALIDAAARRYRAPGPDWVAAAPGSQILIQLLPRLRALSRVAVIGPTYGEHAPCWEAAGHQVEPVGEDALDGDWDVIVLVNPNNPDGRVRDPVMLAGIADRLAARGGWLVVDEAFADLVPEFGMAPRSGCIVLRSFGKFFGLPGLRLGFAIAEPAIARRIAAALGPWPVSGPAIDIALRALADDEWARRTRETLAAGAKRLDAVLGAAGLEIVGGTDLFRLARSPAAPRLFDALGNAGILVRHFPDHPEWLRFGLPADDREYARLRDALS